MNEPSLDAVRATFDSWAGTNRAGDMEDDHRDVVLQMLDRAGLQAHHHVLDAGCGTGWAVRLLAGFLRSGRAYGVDVSESMIAQARGTASPGNAAFTAAPMNALPYGSDSLDRVISMESIYYWSDLAKALDEIHRVLRLGGQFHAAMEYFRENPHSAHWGPRMGLHLHHLSAAEWESSLRAHGFRAVTSAILRDRRPPKTEREFGADPCHPDYQNYLAHKQAGALWIRGEK